MSKPSKGAVHLKVAAASPLDEVFLIDSGLQRVASGVGGLDAAGLAPGVYKLKFKAGDAVTERTVVLNKAEEQVEGSEIPLATAVPIRPLSQTAFTVPASLTSDAPAPTGWNGTGSGLFVQVDAPAPLAKRLATSVTILSEREEMHPLAPRSGNADLDCAPGFYRLRVDAGEVGSIEMMLPALAGRRTAAFLPVRELGYRKPRPAPDLVNVGILMSPLDRRPNPSDPMVRWVEQARLGLNASRAVAPKKQLSDLVKSEQANPLYLLYGAHLLLLEKTVDDELFDRVVSRLQSLMPGHPDAELLTLYARRRDPNPPGRIELSWPPMLTPTWRLLDDPFVRDRVVIQKSSLAARAAGRQRGNSIWFIWDSGVRASTKARRISLSS
jgi:hypothetical protein